MIPPGQQCRDNRPRRCLRSGVAANLEAALAVASVRHDPNWPFPTRTMRAGAVVTGDYAMDPPTAAEVARRERMNRETD